MFIISVAVRPVAVPVAVPVVPVAVTHAARGDMRGLECTVATPRHAPTVARGQCHGAYSGDRQHAGASGSPPRSLHAMLS